LLVVYTCLDLINVRTVEHIKMQNIFFPTRLIYFDAFAKVRKTTIGLVISVRTSAHPSSPTEHTSMKLHFSCIFRQSVENVEVLFKSDNGTLHEGQCTLVITSHSFPSTIKNVAHKICMGNSKHSFYVQ